jgi:hypothetical protein
MNQTVSTLSVRIFLFLLIFISFRSYSQNSNTYYLDPLYLGNKTLKLQFEHNTYNRRSAFGLQAAVFSPEEKGFGIVPYYKFFYQRFKNYGGLFLQPVLYYSNCKFPYKQYFDYKDTVSMATVNSFGGGLGLGMNFRLAQLCVDMSVKGIYQNNQDTYFYDMDNYAYDPSFTTFAFTIAIGYSFPYQHINPKWKCSDNRYKTMHDNGINDAITFCILNTQKAGYVDEFYKVEAYAYSPVNNPFAEDHPIAEIIKNPGNLVILYHDDNKLIFLPANEYYSIYKNIDFNVVEGVFANTGKIVFPTDSKIQPEINYGKWTGRLNNGVPSGNGTFTFTDGSKYVGNMTNGKADGEGSFYSSPSLIRKSNIKSIEGVWKDGYINGPAALSFNIPLSPNEPYYNIASIEGNYTMSERYGTFFALNSDKKPISSTGPNENGKYLFPLESTQRTYNNTTDLGKAAIFLGGAVALGIVYKAITSGTSGNTGSDIPTEKASTPNNTVKLEVVSITRTNKDLSGFGDWYEIKIEFNQKVVKRGYTLPDTNELYIYYNYFHKKYYTNTDRILSTFVGFNEQDVKEWAISKYSNN